MCRWLAKRDTVTFMVLLTYTALPSNCSNFTLENAVSGDIQRVSQAGFRRSPQMATINVSSITFAHTKGTVRTDTHGVLISKGLIALARAARETSDRSATRIVNAVGRLDVLNGANWEVLSTSRGGRCGAGQQFIP